MDWQKQDPSGLAKLGPLRFGKNRTPPDWQNMTLPDWQKQDPSRLSKIETVQIGKNRTPLIGKIGEPFGLAKFGTLPDWDPSGFVKIAFPGLLKFSPDTLPDTFSDAIML